MHRSLELPVLKIPLDTAKSQLSELLGEAEEINRISIETRLDSDLIIQKSYQWLDKAHAFMDQAFGTLRFSEEYLGPVARILLPAHKTQSTKNVKPLDLQEALEISSLKLRTLVDRLPLYTQGASTSNKPKDETTQSSKQGIGRTQSPTERNIFLVHGHDEQLKLEVARFIDSHARLKAVILHEEPSRGKTIIEKLEECSGNAEFAVILMTADDLGAGLNELPVDRRSGMDRIPASEHSIKKLKYRARQNVVLELGYFLGKLGRHRVCVLHDAKVQLPSDVTGIVFISLGSPWHRELTKELRAAKLLD